MILSSLLALATLLDVLLGTQVGRLNFEDTSEPKHASKVRDAAMASAEKMFLTHRNFIDFLKCKNPWVRSAVYSVLGSFIKHVPEVISETNIKSIAASVLGAFQEKDPVCHSAIWDTVILFMKKFPDSWSLVNPQKMVFARLWHFLRSGCWGSQQVSYPALILFLDSLPSKVVSGEKFFLCFFQSTWEGRDPLHSSLTHQLTFFKAFTECFLWVINNAHR